MNTGSPGQHPLAFGSNVHRTAFTRPGRAQEAVWEGMWFFHTIITAEVILIITKKTTGSLPI